jgi:PhnB protein
VASSLNPYISFAGEARQAMEYYRTVFGGELHLNTYGDLGGDQTPPGYAEKIMHSMLETPSGFTLMGADSPPGQDEGRGSGISVSLSGDDGDELRGYWEKLSDGGTVSVPFEKQMWGDFFGMCTDRFGIQWMVNVSGGQD